MRERIHRHNLNLIGEIATGQEQKKNTVSRVRFEMEARRSHCRSICGFGPP
jgi:hypothetical protein